MKLINLNVEYAKHLKTTIPFLEKEDADVLCLHEVTFHTKTLVEELGYHTTFLPIITNEVTGEIVESGSLFASKLPHEVDTFYYYKPSDEILQIDLNNKRDTVAQGCIVGSVQIGGIEYKIATTHFTWTPDGKNPNEDQQTDLPVMLEKLQSYGPHILSGDMNIPRHQSPLYGQFLEFYNDEIPAEYSSSLDKSLHRLGGNPEKLNLFTDYMVDCILTQEPYTARNVRLEFGISDHAAVVAEISV